MNFDSLFISFLCVEMEMCFKINKLTSNKPEHEKGM